MQALDSTTVQFAWDLPLTADEINIRGPLKAYQVILLAFLHDCLTVCVCVDRLRCFDWMIRRILSG